MYLTIQKKSNLITLLTFLVTAAILYGISNLISTHTDWGMLVTIIIFICVVLLVYLFLSILVRNLENILIFKMLGKKQIALAKVSKGKLYKSYRDMFFVNHEIYSFVSEIYTQDGEKKQITLYEDVKSNDFSALPGYLYVTYNGNKNKIGIIPTFYIYLKPTLKDIVQKFEKTYKPHYVEAIKHNGMTINAFKK